MHQTAWVRAELMLRTTRSTQQKMFPLLVQTLQAKASHCYFSKLFHNHGKSFHQNLQHCNYNAHDGLFMLSHIQSNFVHYGRTNYLFPALYFGSRGCINMVTCRPFCSSPEGFGSAGQWGEYEPAAEVSAEDLTAIAQEILSATYQLDVMASALPLQTVVDLLQELKQHDFPTLHIIKLLSGRLWLLQEPQAVKSIAETMAQNGFHFEVTLDLLRNLPLIYCMKERPLAEIPHSIDRSLVQLRGLGFSGKTLSQLVSKSPQVLFMDTKTLKSVFSRLKALFTAADAFRVVATCPNVFYQPWSETNWLFDYAFFTMGYTQPQIVRSEVMACPLDKLRDRHVFLTRAGFFVRVKKKDDPRLNPNPSLQFVVKASDSDFATKFGGLSVEEYSSFLAMREMEREEEEEELGMTDSDIDSSGSDDSDSENDNSKSYKTHNKFKKSKS